MLAGQFPSTLARFGIASFFQPLLAGHVEEPIK